MKRSSALALLAGFVSSLGVIGATAEGRRWMTEVAAEQMDGALAAVAFTPTQRRALEELKSSALEQVGAKVEQLRNALRCTLATGSHRRGPRFMLALPPLGSLSELIIPPPRIGAWRSGHFTGAGYLPSPPTAFATEWRSCRSFSAR